MDFFDLFVIKINFVIKIILLKTLIYLKSTLHQNFIDYKKIYIFFYYLM